MKSLHTEQEMRAKNLALCGMVDDLCDGIDEVCRCINDMTGTGHLLEVLAAKIAILENKAQNARQIKAATCYVTEDTAEMVRNNGMEGC